MLRIPLCLSLCLFLTVDALADDAKEVFDSLYGAKIRQVSATIDRADDIALAKDMLAVAKDSGGTPALQALLCEAVYDLGAKHVDGYATAVEAMQLLAETQPKQREAAREKLIDLLTKQSRIGKPDERGAAADALIELLVAIGDVKADKKDYAAAAGEYRRAFVIAQQHKADSLDSAKLKLQWALQRDRTMKQLTRLQERLLRDATDHATAEAIVRIFVAQLDDPASAVPYLNRSNNEQLETHVKWAIAPIDKLNQEQLLALGEWYWGLSTDSPPYEVVALLCNSQRYLTRFMDFKTDGHVLERTKADILLKDIDKRLASFKAQSPPDREPLAKRSAFDLKQWKVSCWQNKWVDYDVDKMDARADKVGLTFTNKTGIHIHASFRHRLVLTGDFTVEMQITGLRAVGIVPATDGDRWVGITFGSERNATHTIQLIRERGEMAIKKDGHSVTVEYHGTTSADGPVHLDCSVASGEGAAIRRLTVRGELKEH